MATSPCTLLANVHAGAAAPSPSGGGAHADTLRSMAVVIEGCVIARYSVLAKRGVVVVRRRWSSVVGRRSSVVGTGLGHCLATGDCWATAGRQSQGQSSDRLTTAAAASCCLLLLCCYAAT